MTEKTTKPSSPKPTANPTRPYKFSDSFAGSNKPAPKPAANPTKPYKKSV